MTVEEADAAIKKHLKTILKQPEVQVTPAGWRKPGSSGAGEGAMSPKKAASELVPVGAMAMILHKERDAQEGHCRACLGRAMILH